MISVFLGSCILATSLEFWMMMVKAKLFVWVCVGKVHSQLDSALQICNSDLVMGNIFPQNDINHNRGG